MIKNYFKIALRNLKKNKVFSFINIFGLATGLACCMLITVFVLDELSYDQYPAKASNIYRVGLKIIANGGVASYPMVDVAVGAGIKDYIPEVLSYTRLVSNQETWMRYGDKQFKETGMAFADSNFLSFFSIPFLEGDSKTALIQPNTIVITKAFAQKYFGTATAMGKMLAMGKGDLFKVTGVIEKIPDHSHFHKDAFISLATIPAPRQTWSNIGWYTYLRLTDNTNVQQLEKKFSELVTKHVVPEVQAEMGVSLSAAQKTANTFHFYLQPITDIHLHSNTKNELEPNGDINYVYIFGALALFILALACVNFTNLSIAASAKRGREVGIRKVVGSGKRQLIFQFLTESTLLSFCAIVIAYLLVLILLPYFNGLSGKNISFDVFLNYQSIGILLLLGLMVGIVAGIYPAFFLSSFNTIQVLKNTLPVKGGGRKNILRSGLVVFQFSISTALIIATLVVYQQLNYMQHKKLGYDQEQVIYLNDTYLLNNNETAFKQQLIQDNRVVNATITRNAPGNPFIDGSQVYIKDKNKDNQYPEIHVNIYHVDNDYLATLGIKLLQGRNFSNAFATDSSAVIINEAAVNELGLNGTNPIGKTIMRSAQIEYNIIGVVQDFHYASAKQKIAPLMIVLGNNQGGMIVKIKTTDMNGFLTDLKKQWDSYKADGPFAYFFIDEKFAALYAAEQRTGKIFTVFAGLSILIASLGLFGLAAFSTEKRGKEISIRKVLGASITEIFTLFSIEFLILVLIAFLIAIPATWWAMQLWLQDFAFRIHIGLVTFLISGIIVVCIALLAISFHIIKAALSNPIKSLRTE
ncbi:MAG: ABC transporter permease [Bacteroidia bacterium]